MQAHANAAESLTRKDFQQTVVPPMALKKRYVKRFVRKLVFLVLAIAFVSLITTMIVEKRMVKSVQQEDDSKLDPNGDPITPEFRAANVPLTRRAPRPPFQDRNSVHEAPKQEETQVTHTQFLLPTAQGERRDWNDHVAMEADKARTGPGEHGQPVVIEDAAEKELEDKLYKLNGFNALISEKLSVNRSVPDVRLEACKTRKYLSKLPNVSVIFIFYNEHFKTLLRSIYSVMNRTPKELLKQIVLVDDGSEWETLKGPLDEYVAQHFPGIVDIVRNPIRVGLIGARLAGAKVAIGDVMVFFDSHIEVNYNWLPPLLEPIVINPKISTCPIVDNIAHASFEYTGGYQEGSRGGFDWRFNYKQLPVLPEDAIDKSQPYRSPVMMGGLFAINREFFWNLGGYDDGLEIWGAEQYELSFKIWMCGGMLLDVPCSRVAHVFRGPMDPRPSPRNYSFVNRNHKRVAEVWMDEYKEYIYKRDPINYESIDIGDLSRQRAVRERLHCKSFDWYMKEVAPDFLLKFPPVEPPSYAWGAIQNLHYTQYCLDNMGLGGEQPVGMFGCAQNLSFPQASQNWKFAKSRDIRLANDDVCLDVHDSKPNATVYMWNCHNMGGNQFWYYNRELQWIVHGENGHKCLEAFVEDGKPLVVRNECQENNPRQRWQFGNVNNSMLDNFFEDLARNPT
ncbi:N-acetylgalactosaminyltransferase 4-like [Drosophila busckii]|uniref:N-acetylgalactosaminyltransferase 4-like n=1 Tax=Drosophila busckii TaxID=30019 RepID=UPI001432E68B|nr:N-acetylgalactosaminyltransferase 4-like [Drosophila busckii]